MIVTVNHTNQQQLPEDQRTISLILMQLALYQVMRNKTETLLPKRKEIDLASRGQKA